MIMFINRYKMMKERRLAADIDKEEIPPSLEKELQYIEEKYKARKAKSKSQPTRQDSTDSRRSSISVEGDGKPFAHLLYFIVNSICLLLNSGY